MKVIIREAVYTDLERIYEWIAKDSPDNARSVVAHIVETIDRGIASLPFLGRSGRVATTREWIVSGLPYVIVYSVDRDRDVITILAIFHGAQDW